MPLMLLLTKGRELMNYNAEPLLGFMSAVNVEVKRLFRKLLDRGDPRSPSARQEHAANLQPGEEDVDLDEEARAASLVHRIRLWSLLYRTISAAVRH